MDTHGHFSQNSSASVAPNGVQSSPAPRSASERRQPKLRKVTRACDACKSKKKACTGTIPCGPCVRRKASCTYDTNYHRGVAVTPPPSSSQRRNRTPSTASPDTTQEVETELGHEGAADYRESTDVADQYWGPTSAHSFLGWAVRDLPATPSNAIAKAPGPNRTTKTSIFLFGDRAAPGVQLSNFEWPGRAAAEGLARRYFEFACPTYRTLHQPTVERIIHRLYQNDAEGDSPQPPLVGLGESAASQAILLMVFSTATMFQPDGEGRMRDTDEGGWGTSELYFAKAERLLAVEAGAPSLESAQARFLMVLYLLSSSRANKAWFTLGTAIQLMMALGLHSQRAKRVTNGGDLIQRECRRRIVWGSYTLDKYLSVILGRPRLWHDEDLDEELPAKVNDQDLFSSEVRPSIRDCVMDAPVFHVLLSRTLARAVKEPYVVAGISSREQLNTIQALCDRVIDWQAGLPPFLSGAIHPSSLIPVFQRQLTVLQLARYHVLMFITRPLILRNYGQIWPDCEASYVHYLTVCLTAARDAIELILSFVRDNQLFHAFWYSQYIAFNALSIIYIYLIQVQRGRILPISNNFGPSPGEGYMPSLDESTLYRLSETAQYHLADATVRNAPSWKYSAILQGLRRELERLGMRVPTGENSNSAPDSATFRGVPATPTDKGLAPAVNPNYREMRDIDGLAPEDPLEESTAAPIPFSAPPRSGEPYLVDPRTESLFDNFAMDKDLMLDFWPQLDTLPISMPFYFCYFIVFGR